jgi:hypothetical protein
MRPLGTALPEDPWFNPVAVATTGSNISLVAGAQTIDGTLVGQFNSGDPRVQRVLVKDQTSAINNGIYDATADIAWVRSKDANDITQWAQGVQVFVNGGANNAGAIYQVTTAGTNGQIIPTKTAINFSLAVTPTSSTKVQKPASAATVTILASWRDTGIDTRTTAVTAPLPTISAWVAANGGALLTLIDLYGNAATNPITPSSSDGFQWGGVVPLIESNFGILRLRPDTDLGKWLVYQVA